jgi:UDP-N-acetylglucosamine--N-acetylmuramyl-(pentapeptide) pyrophosphoryl-undecaprenol N-acetylglucosamine transferase
MNKQTIFFSGGGTGGHIWPLVPVAKRLNNDYKIFFVGEENSSEQEIARKEGFKFLPIKAAKFQGVFSIINPFTYINQMRGFFRAMNYINRFQPKVIFAKGGYAAFPVALASYCKRVKLIIHESDSVVGKTNRVMAPLAFRFLSGFPKEYYNNIFSNKMIDVGIPVRKEFKPTNLPSNQQVLFIGGSQGSVFINDLVIKIAPKLTQEADIVHICGKDNYQNLKKKYLELDNEVKNRYQLIDYSYKIAKFIKSSSVVISRAGATSIAEIANSKRPAVLIPYPYAAADHQLKNAQILKSKQAALVYLEKDLDSDSFLSDILDLLSNYKLRSQLSENLNRFMINDSSERIEKIIRSI